MCAFHNTFLLILQNLPPFFITAPVRPPHSKVSKPSPGREPSPIKTIYTNRPSRRGHVCMHISHTCTCLLFLHPSAVASVAGRQLGDIEAGTRDTTAHNKNTPGDNRQLTTVFRREREQRKRQTEARNADGIMGGKDRGRI